MFTTVTLNPCIDRTAWINGFTYGEFNAVTKTNVDISGKGINVSVAMANLGIPTHSVFFNFSRDAQVVPGFLEQKNVPYTAIPVEGSLRMNLKIFDAVAHTMTECNEKGNPVTGADVQRAYDVIVEKLEQSEGIILTGSVPPGVPDDFYYNLVLEAKKRGKLAILDADKAQLKEGVKALPDFMKPNRSELQRLVGHELNTFGEIAGAARALIAEGVGTVLVSMGADGAMILNQNEGYFCKASNIEVKGVQGAGDSLVTGMCLALTEGKELKDQLRYAVACANGSLVLEGTQMCTRENFDFMLPRVDVTAL